MKSGYQDDSQESDENPNLEKFGSPGSQSFLPSDKKFSSPTLLDSVLSARPVTVANVWPADTIQTSVTTPKTPNKSNPRTTKRVYRVQLLAVADFETAQNKKASYSEILGIPLQVVFDAPFYKVRTGRFPTRQKAREKLLDIQNLGLQGFIVKE